MSSASFNLTRYGGQRRAVVEAMGISERTLYRKLRRYGLN
jgi:DNA-binding NtrC family response regulator